MRNLRSFVTLTCAAILMLSPLAGRASADETDPEMAILKGHKGAVRNVAYAADGKLLVSLGTDDRTIRIWDVAATKQKVVLAQKEKGLRMALAPNGKLLAVSCDDKTIRLWSLPTAKPLAILKGHDDRSYKLRFSADSKLLATADFSRVIKVWKVSGELLQTIEGHSRTVNDMVFTSDNKVLITTGDDKTMKKWSVQTGKRLKTIDLERTLYSLDVTKDRIVGVDGAMVRTWDVDTGKEQNKVALHSGAAFVGPRPYARIGKNQKTAAVLNGSMEVRLVDLEKGRLLGVAGGFITYLIDFDVCPKERLIAGAGDKGNIMIWSMVPEKDGKCKNLAVLKEHTKAATSISFSPNGKVLVSASEDGTIRLWDVAVATSKKGR